MESSFVWLHRLSDLILPPLVLYLIVTTYGINWTARYQNAAVLSGLLQLIVSQYIGLYHSWRGRSLFEGVRIVLNAWIMVWVFLIILAFALKTTEHFSRLVLSTWFIATPFLLFSYRVIIRAILARLYNTGHFIKNAAIYGTGDACERLQSVLRKNQWLGYRITGIYDGSPSLNTEKFISGGIKELIQSAKEGYFQTLYITMAANREDEIKILLNELADTTVTVKYIPDFFSFDLIHSSMTNVGGLPVINIYDSPLNDPGKALIKRLEDLILSTIILMLISPIILGIAFIIKFTSPGPIIFKQKRYGLNGEEIKVYKFRSMTTQDNGSVVNQAIRNDPRITRTGAFLRRTSLDELPQFLNVIQGRMSIVGPRPHAVAHNEEYRNLVPKYMQRHLVKPGITGWAQINGWRGETDTLEKMEKRIEFDLFYINHWSLWLDIKIIILTVFKGFMNKNAY